MSENALPKEQKLCAYRGDTMRKAIRHTRTGYDWTGSTVFAELRDQIDGVVFLTFDWTATECTITVPGGSPVIETSLSILQSGEELYVPWIIPHQLMQNLNAKTGGDKAYVIDFEVTKPDGDHKTFSRVKLEVTNDASKAS